MELETRRIKLLDVNRRESILPVLIDMLEERIYEKLRNNDNIISRKLEFLVKYNHDLVRLYKGRHKKLIDKNIVYRQDETYLTEQDVETSDVIKKLREYGYDVQLNMFGVLTITWNKNFPEFSKHRFLKLQIFFKILNLIKCKKLFSNGNFGNEYDKFLLEKYIERINNRERSDPAKRDEKSG